MAGAMRKMGVYLGLVEDDQLDRHADDYETYGSTARARDTRGSDWDDDYDRPSRAETRRRTDWGHDDARDTREAYDAYDHDDEYDAPVSAAVTPARRVEAAPRKALWTESGGTPSRTSSGGSAVAVATAPKRSSYRITTLHPRTYNEARTIGEHFRDSVPVIMNLTEMDDADAKRLVDFAAGLSFGLRGSIERVTNKVFLLSPHNVSVTAEDKARIAEGGFFNQS